jgi:hypothetical protein
LDTNFQSDKLSPQIKQQVYGIIKSELENAVDKTAQLEQGVTSLQSMNQTAANPQEAIAQIQGQTQNPVYNSAAKDQYMAANKQYAQMAALNKMSDLRSAGYGSNNEVSLRDTMAGLTGMATGGPGGAIVMGGISKVARKYGASLEATGANAVADMIQKSPESLGRFLSPLQDAASRGSVPLAVTHYVLNQLSPDYQNMWNGQK